MNTTIRASFWSSVFMYLGLIAGGALYMILSWSLGSAENVGFYRLITANASILAIFIVMGMPQTIIRFFPHFQDPAHKHHGFVGFFMLVTAAGFVFTSLLCLLFKPEIIHCFIGKKNAVIVNQFYLLTLLFAGFVGFYNVLQSYAQAVMKPARTYFYREIIVKLGIFMLALGCGLHLLSFDVFIYGVVILFGLLVFLTWLYLYRQKDYMWSTSFHRFDPATRKEISTFSFYNFIYYANVYLIENVDALIISKLAINNLADNGVYAVYMFMGYAVVIPQKAITSTTGPMVAQAFKNNDLDTVTRLYRKTSLIQLIIGGLVFVGMVINLPNFETFFGQHDPLFIGSSSIAILLGAAKLFDAATGMNSSIISMSPYYRWNFYMNLFLLILVIALDILILPRFGILGIALVTGSMILLGNLIKLVLIWVKFSIQPFAINTIKTLLLIAFVLILNYVIPSIKPWYADLILRSSIITIVYGVLVYVLKLSPDINGVADKIILRLRSVLGQ